MAQAPRKKPEAEAPVINPAPSAAEPREVKKEELANGISKETF